MRKPQQLPSIRPARPDEHGTAMRLAVPAIFRRHSFLVLISLAPFWLFLLFVAGLIY